MNFAIKILVFALKKNQPEYLACDRSILRLDNCTGRTDVDIKY
jgi:hypothetical protein